jgi:hypothetical protein
MSLMGDSRSRCSFAHDNLVRFPMFDGDVFVTCGVTPAALLKFAVAKGLDPLRVEAIFERCRLEIEAIAGSKYDRGEMDGDELIVDAADL